MEGGLESPSMTYKSPPSPCFLDEKTPVHAKRDRKRWCDDDRLYEWDSQHGEIEVYNKRGKHLGSLDPAGKWIKEAVKGRTIDV